MDAKRQIAEQLQAQSSEVWAYRVKHYEELTREQRFELKDAARTLNARADEVLEDALEEGIDQAEQLIAALEQQTAELEQAKANIDRVGDILDIVGKASKAAAGVVSGGISNALPFLA